LAVSKGSSHPTPAGQDKVGRPWLKPYAALPPAARQHEDQQVEAGIYFVGEQLQQGQQRRKRPFIYVYDMAPVFTSLMLQVSRLRAALYSYTGCMHVHNADAAVDCSYGQHS
jgi:hypothetical protein